MNDRHTTSPRWWEQWDNPGIAGAINDFWLKDLSGYEELYRQNIARLMSIYHKAEMKKVLEVGCGSGLIFAALCPAIIRNEYYLGVDTSTEMLKIARQEHSEGHFEFGDAFGLKYPDRSFDLVVSFEVIVHLPEMKTPLAEMLRVADKMVVFTAWVAETENVIPVELLHVKFIHHYYEHNKILDLIHVEAGSRPHHVEVRVLSDHAWAYVVFLDQAGEDRLLPFPGLTARHIAHTKEIQVKLRAADQKNSGLEQELLQSERKLDETKQTLLQSEQKLNQMEQALFQNGQKLNQAKQRLFQSEQKLNQTTQELFHRGRELVNRNLEILRHQQKFHHLEARSLHAVNELNGLRESRVSRILNRFRQLDLLPILNPVFQQFVDDTYIFQNNTGFLLQPSLNLQKIDFLGYNLEFNRPGLCGIWIAPLLDIPLSHGWIGIEIVSPQNKIILQQVSPVEELREDMPCHFVFPSIEETKQGVWKIRVFSRDLDGPIRLAEWRKYAWRGFGRLKTRAFFAFDFYDGDSSLKKAYVE
jgi:ubiquinone/menaquinone biosynthesis C-methylase UbiE